MVDLHVRRGNGWPNCPRGINGHVFEHLSVIEAAPVKYPIWGWHEVCDYHARAETYGCLACSPQVLSQSKRAGVGIGVSGGKTARTQSGCMLSSLVVPGPETKIDTCYDTNTLAEKFTKIRETPNTAKYSRSCAAYRI